MSVSKIHKFQDKDLEFTLEIKNQELELSLRLEKEIEVEGYPNIVIRPQVYCKTLNDEATTKIEVPVEVKEKEMTLEEQRQKLENDIALLIEEQRKERIEIEKHKEQLQNELDELKKFDETLKECEEEVVAVTEAVEVSAEGAEEPVVERSSEEVVEELEKVSQEPSEVVQESLEVSEGASEVVQESSDVSEGASEVIEEPSEVSEETKEDIKVNDDHLHPLGKILERFGDRLENIINKIEIIEKRHQHHAVEKEIIEPIEPKTPQQNPTPKDITPIVEKKPHPPPMKPHPPPPIFSPKAKQSSQKPLNFEIIDLHNKYMNDNIEVKLVDVIIDHMKCVDSYPISGKEKKNMVLDSIDSLLNTNDMRSENRKLLRNLSSKLIDTFYSLDKHNINITEKPPSTFGCFPR